MRGYFVSGTETERDRVQGLQNAAAHLTQHCYWSPQPRMSSRRNRPPPPPATEPRKRKGPKQKGAGAIVRSKGDVQANGITIKEWQRTPKQLLLQFTQNQKRPNPLYKQARAGGPERFLFRVVLRDPKGVREKDIVVCPTKDFGDRIEAEHAAALLALHLVDGERQHEKKLPEPYRTAWLQLTGRLEEASAAEEAAAGAAAPSTEGLTCEHCGKSFKKEHGLKQHVKREHPAPPKPPPDEAGAEEGGDEVGEGGDGSAAGGQVAAEAGASAADPGFDLFGAGEGDALATDLAEVSGAVEQLKDKASGLSGLAMRGKFATQHERRMARNKREARERKFARQKEAERASNPHPTVFMTEANRIFVEGVIREMRQGVHGHAVGLPTVGLSDDAELTPELQLVFENVCKLGFERGDVLQGLQAVRARSPDGAWDESTVLDWLCLSLPEEKLPSGFDPRGTQLDVVLPSSAMAGGRQGASQGTDSAPCTHGLVQVLGVSASTGNGNADIALAEAYNEFLRSAVADDEGGNNAGAAESLEPWPPSARRIQEICANGHDGPSATDEEWLALEAIFEPGHAETRRYELHGEPVIVYALLIPLPRATTTATAPDDETKAPNGYPLDHCVLEVHAHERAYPVTPPLVNLLVPGAQLSARQVRAACVHLAQLCRQEFAGEPCAFALWDACKSLVLPQVMHATDATPQRQQAATRGVAGGQEKKRNVGPMGRRFRRGSASASASTARPRAACAHKAANGAMEQGAFSARGRA